MKYIRPIITSYACVLSIMIAAWGCGPKTPEQKQKIMMAALKSKEGQKALDKLVELITKLQSKKTGQQPDGTQYEVDLTLNKGIIEQRLRQEIVKNSKASKLTIPSEASFKSGWRDSPMVSEVGTDAEYKALAKAEIALYEVIYKDFI